MRADENGTKLLAALNHAASKGIKIQLLIDGIYQQLFLAKSRDFQALASWENVEVGVYNPVTPAHLLKVNYRMHDKYLIIDEKMYLLGGRNSNDIFLGGLICSLFLLSLSQNGMFCYSKIALTICYKH